ncbi:MAG: DNA photolyase family protein [Bacteroidia bacterium]|nr:DNA photolyase family protein [Bacteroidia bacterium]
MRRKPINIVWFKRDLRLTDHQPLLECIQQPLPTLLLYCFEPELMHAPDSDVRHLRFVWESLIDLQGAMPSKEAINIVYANAMDAFQYVNQHYHIQNLFSHQETGNHLSYQRDLTVAKFCKENGIVWKEFQSNGVIRRLSKRSEWNALWHQTMLTPILPINLSALQPMIIDWPKAWHQNKLPEAIKQSNGEFQIGGESNAHKLLHSFIEQRSVNYLKHISKPLQSRTGCSRLSPYLAFGNLSIRQVFQATTSAIQRGHHKRQLTVFAMRLHWHCHFIQKFESECRMEFENLNRAFNGVRNEYNQTFYDAWANGQTGYPLIDACMQCLAQTGYINFRMRAMLVSFLTHNLWQHWKTGVHHLARYFLDYEPGIHYPQFQMQAGTMGVHTIRTYNPVKQSKDHDPEGVFVKKWIPSLQRVPVEFIHEPWLMPIEVQKACGCIIGLDYPLPIIPLNTSSREANAALWNIKKTDEAKHEGATILAKHSSRKTTEERSFSKRKSKITVKNSVDLNYKLF